MASLVTVSNPDTAKHNWWCSVVRARCVCQLDPALPWRCRNAVLHLFPGAREWYRFMIATRSPPTLAGRLGEVPKHRAGAWLEWSKVRARPGSIVWRAFFVRGGELVSSTQGSRFVSRIKAKPGLESGPRRTTFAAVVAYNFGFYLHPFFLARVRFGPVLCTFANRKRKHAPLLALGDERSWFLLAITRSKEKRTDERHKYTNNAGLSIRRRRRNSSIINGQWFIFDDDYENDPRWSLTDPPSRARSFVRRGERDAGGTWRV